MKKIILLALLPLLTAATLAPAKIKWEKVKLDINKASFKVPEGYVASKGEGETSSRKYKYTNDDNGISIIVSISDIKMAAHDYDSKVDLVDFGLNAFKGALGDITSKYEEVKDNRGHPGKRAVLSNEAAQVNYWVLIGDDRMYQFVITFPKTSSEEGENITQKLFKSVKLDKPEKK